MRDTTTSLFDDTAKFRPQAEVIPDLIAGAALTNADRATIHTNAARLVRQIREGEAPGIMEQFLGEYGLSTEEGVALMCLAEALLRVPDHETIDALIEDKIAPSDWGKHIGQAASPLVNASTWALLLTGRVLDDEQRGMAGTLRGMVRRLGEPVIRVAVGQAMREMGRQFVLGETIEGALKRARKQEARGYTYSYDMLGEAAMTARDAGRYADSYAHAIKAIGAAADRDSVAANPGISVKLSALHPRYEVAQEARVLEEVVPRLRDLARMAARSNIGLNIDAEEQDRLVLSLKVIGAVLADPELHGWDGFGVVVQAYGKRAGAVIDWLHATAERLDRRLMVRLVKGAYWDTEMKHSQVEGHPGFPLFTTKPATDVSYLANARKLIGYADRLYPQFATHNAHTVAAIRHMARGIDYEFQRLHGMGESLHDIVMREEKTRCRIYAPVGAHRDLLAYLVRRLLENGANSSFVNQIVDESVSPEVIAADPITQATEVRRADVLAHPSAIFGPKRRNSAGFDLTDETTLARIDAARDVAVPDAGPLVAGGDGTGTTRDVVNPATGEKVAQVTEADEATVAGALDAATPWAATATERAQVMRRAADLYEDHYGPLFAALHREAGKSLADAVGELREAVDFLRYYAGEGEKRDAPARGIITAISPWNFPLAIFTGQISAALMAGNAVIAKPAEQTPLVAAIAVRLLHEAGVPRAALQFLPGDGATVGVALTSDARVDGVVFTGSTDTAQIIRRAMAENLAPGAPLIAETGGLNAMIVDSTALPEQAVRDIVASAFQSAGQRCSALRCLYVQEDVSETLIRMLTGAMDELSLGDPWHLSTDVGPVIDGEAQADILGYLDANKARILHQVAAPEGGTFVPPTLLKVGGIDDLEREVFGPVLHVATFKADALEQVIDDVNARGFGLTFGLHTRIDGRVEDVSRRIRVGNAYVNRNQIGAIVGSQPFGGEGLSGTGPKAGGPDYVGRFSASPVEAATETASGAADPKAVQARLSEAEERVVSEELLPGPTGELNRLTHWTRPPVLCLGPGAQAARAQAKAVREHGGVVVEVADQLPPEVLETLDGFSAALWWGDDQTARTYARALAKRDGAILPLVTERPDRAHACHERHLCVDTTAAGGNADLLARSSG
ncbi:bifunctional proline dehydrogenase/L-glutamate gamma-semialdehyde dehydrogenase PutA [Maritimibacter sp. UBA3975]|uniref:bifunctional proline dehydrogenase/L-glutamate gamma-semialdehyde dehydrogenase PutA n=1 Tax=Maritimibacter sp. UBA3975 TaxID=1946833 RepID=UPI000C0ACE24|nr:bifunctional proline dehydrogenase/L-glutamate gamma-semialdehyde dehydrogenase PutA [Maritimibacter sp. UBA3975]MAM62785.1 bifunctional proline dehydrogenase/L-glutamate gamma-semialdehyde dehydrogenase [Maritimibacter sp.]|tara:strand:+ start:23727 stop:27143 length:3417 start_codon:yes stop_codon:yes gene_type:complete